MRNFPPYSKIEVQQLRNQTNSDSLCVYMGVYACLCIYANTRQNPLLNTQSEGGGGSQTKDQSRTDQKTSLADSTLLRLPKPSLSMASTFQSGSGGINWGTLGELRTHSLSTPRGSVHKTASPLYTCWLVPFLFVVTTSTPVRGT